MKNTIVITLFVGMMTVFSANAQKGMDAFKVQVDGLGCPFCAYGLEKKFKEFKGIKDVKIDIETGDFSFNYPSEKMLTMEAVEAQVVKAGYTPMTSYIKRADGTIEESTPDQNETMVAGADLKAEEVIVGGNCEMCKARIEKAAKGVAGVSTVDWNKDTKILLVEFDPSKSDLRTIEKAISAVGHDTENTKADEETYNNLPACCLYERIN
ncbi:MAG: heavy-metal-associated domain-containing protein [Flavobacteriaceae bacterium]|nr:heavy-metal-associated domain-containing protein [Flavobacteriaceae bacterium]